MALERAPPGGSPTLDPSLRHGWLEDLQALLIGTLLVALLAQKKRGWRAGQVQMAIDAAIVAATLLTVTMSRVLMSIAAVVVLNLVIATNHRPERHVAQ